MTFMKLVVTLHFISLKKTHFLILAECVFKKKLKNELFLFQICQFWTIIVPYFLCKYFKVQHSYHGASMYWLVLLGTDSSTLFVTRGIRKKGAWNQFLFLVCGCLYRSWKSRKLLNSKKSFSRPGKSRNTDTGPGKSLKSQLGYSFFIKMAAPKLLTR